MITIYPTIKTIVENHLCSGCGTCKGVCPTQAIRMGFTTLGRLVPSIDDTACVHCGLCLKLCPSHEMEGITTDSTLLGHMESAWFAKSAERGLFDNAQSGGAVTATLAYLFKQGRIDAALVVGQHQQKAHCRVVTSSEGLRDCQSSQYTPVDLNSALPELAQYTHVAVVGLPCHIEGIVKLKAAFPERYANIEYLLGLICGGVLAQSCVEVVKRLSPKPINDDSRIYWRLRKYSNYKNAKVAIVDQQGAVTTLDNNIRLSCKTHLTPPRCLRCLDKMNLFCDMVFGDSWGITGDDTKGGGNVVIARTTLAQTLVEEMVANGVLTARPCPVSEIDKGQHLDKKRQLLDPAHKDAYKSQIDTFLQREQGDRAEVVADIARQVKRRAAWKRFTGKIRKLLKIG